MTRVSRHNLPLRHSILGLAVCAVDGGTPEECVRASGLDEAVARRLLAHPIMTLIVAVLSLFMRKRRRSGVESASEPTVRRMVKALASASDSADRSGGWHSITREIAALRRQARKAGLEADGVAPDVVESDPSGDVATFGAGTGSARSWAEKAPAPAFGSVVTILSISGGMQTPIVRKTAGPTVSNFA
ncbi:MAG: hypothetical protein R3C97_06755 [Geminicoccaceae bacterium]